MSQSNRHFFRWTALALFALLLGVGSVSAFNLPGIGKGGKVQSANGAVTIPVATVSDGKAHFFRFADAGKEITFFVVKGTDGALHAAFDACDVCFQEKKGYFQEGDYMVCKNCNRKFITNRIGRVAGGGCNPSQLNFAQKGKNIIIQVADLKQGSRFF